MFTTGKARNLTDHYRGASAAGQHLVLTNIGGRDLGVKGLLVEQVSRIEEYTNTEIAITVWFEDVMADIVLDSEVEIEWENRS